MRIVAAAVTLESVSELNSVVKDFAFTDVDIACLSVSCARKAGAYHLMTAQNPVYLFTFQRREAAV